MRMGIPLFGLQKAFPPQASQCLYYMSTNSKGSCEAALMRKLAGAFAGRLPFFRVLTNLGKGDSSSIHDIN